MSGTARAGANLPRMLAAAAAVAGIVVACVLRLQAGAGAGTAGAPGALEAVTQSRASEAGGDPGAAEPPGARAAAGAAGARDAPEAAAAPAPAGDLQSAAGTFVVETVIGSEAVADVRAGETAVVNFVVPRRATVGGVVREDGRPRSGVVVRHRRVLAPALCHLACRQGCGDAAETATSDADGRFEQSLPYGGDVALWAEGPDGLRGPEVRINLASGIRFEVELDLPPRRK